MIFHLDSNQKPFQADAEFKEAIERYTWHEDAGYPRTGIGKRPTRRLIRLHWFLFGRAPKGLVWDHINRDRMDNRRENLRLVTRDVNARNRSARVKSKSGVNGVRWEASRQKWQARIGLGGTGSTFLGHFDTFEEAVECRRSAERERWGVEYS